MGEIKFRELLELFVRQSIIWRIQKVPANGLCNFVLAITQDRKMWYLYKFCVKYVNLLIAFYFNLATHMLICFLLGLMQKQLMQNSPEVMKASVSQIHSLYNREIRYYIL